LADALANVTEKDTTYARLQVVRGLAMALLVPASERTLWIQEALVLTRDSGDLRARLDVLCGALRCYTRMPDGANRLALAEEMFDLAHHLGSPEDELEARQWKAQFLLELGRGEEYAQQVSDYARRAAIVRTPYGSWTANTQRVGQLFLSGDLAESERLARETADAGEKLMGMTASIHRVAELFQVGLELTETDAERVLGDVQARAERILSVAPNYHVIRTILVRAALYCGRPCEADQYMASIAAPNYVPPDPLDGHSLMILVNAADMAAEMCERRAAAVIFELLGAHDGLHAVSATGAVYLGPVSYWLGRLCLTLGRDAAGADYLDRALRATRESGSVTYRAWSEYYLARAMRRDARAATLLDDAERVARRFGLSRLLANLRADG
ncbi:MAG TPA: hypothetical protein VFU02_16000, partial [Polyangiaceae bacterium]|nr:hypothetical protein [Polyangiaceae bacterium]